MNYQQAALALNPDSYWPCNEPSGTTLADLVGGKNLTISGTPNAFNVATGLVGVNGGIDFGAANVSYARIGSALTQVATNKFSIGGWFYWNGSYGANFSNPIFCASFSGGHTDPFYIFYASVATGNAWRLAVDTTGSFAPFDSGVGLPSQNAWHLILMSYASGSLKLYVDDLVSVTTSSITGNVGSMGSFALNTIPASTVLQGPLRTSSVAYWHDYQLTQSDVDGLWAARLDSGIVVPNVRGPGRSLGYSFA